MKVIVTTTINPVTEAVRKFDALEDWHLVVIGDKKTPTGYHLERGAYIDPDTQQKYDPELSEAIGWNCIQRRNFGFLWAHDMGAEIVAVVDDDNIPSEDWGQDLMVGREVEVNFYRTDLPAFDPVGATNEKHLWHRGFPIQLIPSRNYDNVSKETVHADVQADFWNGDPDIDAICRIEHAPECKFDPEYFPLAADKISPFNSQNTFMSAAVLKDYFLFPFVGRMDDIWASYYLQAKGYKVIYGKPTVVQSRNAHDLIKDMKLEYLGYENNLNLINDLAVSADKIFDYIPERAARAFELYRKHFD